MAQNLRAEVGESSTELSFDNFVEDLAIAESDRKAMYDQKNYEDIITVTTTKVKPILRNINLAHYLYTLIASGSAEPSWRSWLARQSHNLKVVSSSLTEGILFFSGGNPSDG